MNVTVLGSGSRGNAVLVNYDETTVLIDSGFSLKETIKRIENSGFLPEKLDAVVVTHYHSDHIYSAMMVSRRFNIPVWCTADAFPYLKKKAKGAERIEIFDNSFVIKQLNFMPVQVPHDAAGTVAYYINSNGKALTVATDLGAVPSALLPYLHKSQVWILESNHDCLMLENGPYSLELKRRVASKWGHLSNRQAVEIVTGNSTNDTQTIVFAHLSQKNNSREVVSEMINRHLIKQKEKINFHIAFQDRCLPVIKW